MDILELPRAVSNKFLTRGSQSFHVSVNRVLSRSLGAATNELHRKYTIAANIPSQFRSKHHWHSMLQWKVAVNNLQREFAAVLGWNPGKRFSPRQLADRRCVPNRHDKAWIYGCKKPLQAWDHVEYFRIGRLPAGIVVHVYDQPHRECDELAERFGLTFAPLPWSWYFPKAALAGVYLPLRKVVTP